MYRFLGLWGCLLFVTRVQAQRADRPLVPVRFKAPVEVFFRLNSPVPGAEYRLIMEAQLAASLDTLSFTGLLHQPGIYFAKVFTESIATSPSRKYYKTAPIAQGAELYPFNERKVNIAHLARPLNGTFYTQQEAATRYRGGMVRKDATDFGPPHPPDTLPGVDSVRVVYVIQIRPHWKRGTNQSTVK